MSISPVGQRQLRQDRHALPLELRCREILAAAHPQPADPPSPTSATDIADRGWKRTADEIRGRRDGQRPAVDDATAAAASSTAKP
jgi:hypothetical protein